MDIADKMPYQLTWKTLPGLRGLGCSEFRATHTSAPNLEQGVAFDCPADDEREAFLRELETHFAPQRFSNGASAFESVKAYVLDKMGGGQ
jgi:hypothetical protein